MSKYATGGECGDFAALTAGYNAGQINFGSSSAKPFMPSGKDKPNYLNTVNCPGDVCVQLAIDCGANYSLSSPISQRCAECLSFMALKGTEASNA